MKFSPEDSILSGKSKSNKKATDSRPYFENTHQVFTPAWVSYKNPSLKPEEDSDSEDEEKRPKGKALLKKIYGGGECNACKRGVLDKVAKNYTKVINHLEEHLAEKAGDPKDAKQSKQLRRDLTSLKDAEATRASKVLKRDHLYKVSNPKEVQKRATEIYGKKCIIYKSDKPAKKYMVMNPVTGKWIHFGDAKMEDFTKHEDPNRRKRYLDRSLNIKGNWRDDIYSPNYLSILLLW